MSEKFSTHVAELMDEILSLPHDEAEALFMATGVVLSERNPERLAKLLEKHIIQELKSKKGENEPGIFHIFALTLNLTLERVARRVQVDNWCDGETVREAISSFGIWNTDVLSSEET